MKKLKYVLPFILSCSLMFSSFESQAIKLVFGTKSHPDHEGGCTGTKGICIVIEIKLGNFMIAPGSLGDDMGTVDAVLINKSQIRLDILSDNAMNNNGPTFVVEKDVRLSAEVSKGLGANSVTIQAGTYKVDYSKFANGSVILPVVTQ